MTDYFDLTQDVENGEIYSVSDLLDQQNIILTTARLLPDLYVGIKSLATNVSTHFSLTSPDFSSVPSTVSFSTTNVSENDTILYFEDLEELINDFKDMLYIVKSNWLNIYKKYLNEKTPNDLIGDLIESLDETGFPNDFDETHLSYDLTYNQVINDVEINLIHTHLLNLLKTAKYIFGILYDIKVDNGLTIASMPNVTITAKQIDTTNLISSPSTNVPTIDGTIFHSVRNASYPNATTYIWTPSDDDRHKYGIYNHDTSEWEILTDTYTQQSFPTITDSEVEDKINNVNYNHIMHSVTNNFIVKRGNILYYITLRCCAIDYTSAANRQAIWYFLKYNSINLDTNTTNNVFLSSLREYDDHINDSVQQYFYSYYLNYTDNFSRPFGFDVDTGTYYHFEFDNISFSSLLNIQYVSDIEGTGDEFAALNRVAVGLNPSGYLALSFFINIEDEDSEEYLDIKTCYCLGNSGYLSSSSFPWDSNTVQTIRDNNFYDNTTNVEYEEYGGDEYTLRKFGLQNLITFVYGYDYRSSYSRAMSNGYSMNYMLPISSTYIMSNSVQYLSKNFRYDSTSTTNITGNRTSNFTTTYDFYKPNTFPHYFVYQRNNLTPYVYETTIDVSSITEEYITFCPRLNNGWYHTISSEKNDEINKQTDTIKYFVNFYGNAAEKLTNYNIYLLSWD